MSTVSILSYTITVSGVYFTPEQDANKLANYVTSSRDKSIISSVLYVFGVKESKGDNEKILSSLQDLENQGQTPFWVTFLISGCKHDTKLILVSILTFSRSWISDMLQKITWHWRLTLKLEVTHIHFMTFLISGCIQATDLILVSILTFSRSRISENPKSVTWPWWLIIIIIIIIKQSLDYSPVNETPQRRVQSCCPRLT